MVDETEGYRRQRVAELNSAPVSNDKDAEKKRLEAETGGPVYTTDEMSKEFEALGFAAPYIIVKRRSDGSKGSLEFQHSPRLYFNWQKD
jgi:hypothetical protein